MSYSAICMYCSELFENRLDNPWIEYRLGEGIHYRCIHKFANELMIISSKVRAIEAGQRILGRDIKGAERR